MTTVKISTGFFLFALTLLTWVPVSQAAIPTIPTGTGPWAVGVNPVTGKVYVANHFTGVTVIDGARVTTVASVAGNYGYGSCAVAVNPVTNKIYVTNDITDDVTVIDGATDLPVMVKDATAKKPIAVAVNTVTNKVYVANKNSNTVTVIDGATNATETIVAGSMPYAVAVNPLTNMIYVANHVSSDVTVINGVDNSTATVAIPFQYGVAHGPQALAVNPRTNKVYVVDFDGIVTILNGATATIGAAIAGTVTVDTYPAAVGVNPVTNKIYVVNVNFSIGSVSVIDGVSNVLTATVPVGMIDTSVPVTVTVNPVSNMIYIANPKSNNINIINGSNDSTTTVAVGSNPSGIGVNVLTGDVYVANSSSNDVTFIAGTSVPVSPLLTVIPPLPGNVTSNLNPTFNLTATSATGSPVNRVYYQVGSTQGSWLTATPNGGSFTAVVPTPTMGAYTIYAFATDGSDATSINTGAQSSPLIGAIASYTFSVIPPPPVTYTVDAANTAHGSISPNIQQIVLENAVLDFALTPDSGYKIGAVTGCGGAMFNATTYRTAPITAHCTVTPAFSSTSLPVRVGATTYSALQSAYDLGVTPLVTVIQAMDVSVAATPLAGDLNINRIAATLLGGYDGTYGARTGNTVMVGRLIVSAGSLTVDRLVIQ